MLRMIERSREKEGSRVETTVIPSRILHGVFGIARTTFVVERTHAAICGIVTPARMLIRSLPANACCIPGSPTMVWASCGLQHRRTTSASATARRFSPTSTSTPVDINVDRSFFALSSRLTQARKREGREGSFSERAVGVDVPDVCDSHLGLGVWLRRGMEERESRLAKTPERMATPIVPHPSTQSVYPIVKGQLEDYLDQEIR